MICPTCQAELEMLPGHACRSTNGAIVEGSLLDSTGTPTLAGEATDSPAPAAPAAWLPAPIPTRPAHPVWAALPRVPALLWRQPVVRAAVRTGASAVALSLAVRLAERALAVRADQLRSPAGGAAPLAELLLPPAPVGRGRRGRSGHRREAEVTEMLIYLRRVSYE